MLDVPVGVQEVVTAVAADEDVGHGTQIDVVLIILLINIDNVYGVCKNHAACFVVQIGVFLVKQDLQQMSSFTF